MEHRNHIHTVYQHKKEINPHNISKSSQMKVQPVFTDSPHLIRCLVEYHFKKKASKNKAKQHGSKVLQGRSLS